MADKLLIDPKGRRIILHDHTWRGHVLKGHPEIRAYRTVAEGAITSPAAVVLSNSDSDCRIFFGRVPRRRLYIAVVADVIGGFVKTAYLTGKVRGKPE